MKSNLLTKLVCALCMGAMCLPSVVTAKDIAKPAPDGFNVSLEPAPSIRLLTPNGGEKFAQGSMVAVKWDCVPRAEYYSVYLTTDAGKSYSVIAAELGTGECAFDWKVDAPISTECLIRVEYKAEDARIVHDDSDSRFSIVAAEGEVIQPKHAKEEADNPTLAAPPSEPNVAETAIVVVPQLAMKSPNGGESYKAGSKIEVSWQCEPLAVNYEVYWSYDGGKSFLLVADRLDASKCTFDWKAPHVALNNCLIKVVGKSATNLVIEAVSARPFVIVADPGKTPVAK